ncbi:hypothetical protein [Moorena sp. SIO3A5]|uniref:Uncharacterized protein n=1 Tax=Moorena producens 3L TaxID=489825 RepID=F4XZW9_9CYAN|nr:hypothetical protein [Moorena sp. SIO3A5]EGJ29887.1 hypothetical protein LYNGBM3L_59140 [Moorena producens 3L]OLT66428.1 hypothetical protein BI334_16680 [Moorena producens 3L]
MPSNYSYLVARPPPNLNVQLLKATSAISYQLSAISYQLSAISYQLSAISYQLMRTLREQLLNKIS